MGAEVGVSKAGRYTSEGAGNASTEMTPGKLIPDPLMNYHPGFAFDWELDLFGKLKSSKKRLSSVIGNLRRQMPCALH